MDQRETFDEVRDRLKHTFADTYLTLLSIIQGTALALLFSKIDYLIERKAFHAPQVVMAMGIFLTIALLWNQYQVGVMLYVWVPQLIDAMIPFSLGACEFIAILGLQYGSIVTVLTYAVFFVLAIFAFEYQYAQVGRAGLGHRSIHLIVRGFREQDRIVNTACALVLIITAIFLMRFPPPQGQSLLASTIIVAIGLLHGARLIIQWRLAQNRLRHHRAL